MIYCRCLGKETEAVKQGNCVFNKKKVFYHLKRPFSVNWVFHIWLIVQVLNRSQEVALYSIPTLLYLSLCAIFLLAK